MLILKMFRGVVSDDQLSSVPRFVEALPARLRRVVQPTRDAQAAVFGLASDALPRMSPPAARYAGATAPAPSEGEILTDGASICIVALRVSHSTTIGQIALFEPQQPESSAHSAPALLEVGYIGSDPHWSQWEEIRGAAREILGTDLHQIYFPSIEFDRLRGETREAPAPPTEVEVAGAAVLRDRHVRVLAIAIKSSGGLLVRDIARQLPPEARERSQDLLTELRRAGLIDAETVVVCTKTQAQTARAATRGLLEEMSARGLRCACGRPIADERVEEALTLTELGKALLDKSRWLTVLVVRELLYVGVRLEDILVEHQLGGDELDCIANVSGELVLFELKDKEFNLGSAYSFGAKIGIIRPNHSVIVSTERVGSDAKEHFRRAGLTRDPGMRINYGFSARGGSDVQYIEGVEQIGPGIQRVAGWIYVADARRLINEVLPLATLDATGLLRLLGHAESAGALGNELAAALDELERRTDDDDLPF